VQGLLLSRHLLRSDVGIIWDKQGHVITNFHVLGNVLKVWPVSQYDYCIAMQRYSNELVGAAVDWRPRVANLILFDCQQRRIASPNPARGDRLITVRAVQGLGNNAKGRVVAKISVLGPHEFP
jgi:hypothetical protein